MSVDRLVADVGSTITKISALRIDGERSRLLGQGVARSSVDDGDVAIGLERARQALDARHGLDTRGWPMQGCCSAAGGLRMTVHGLTEQMTMRAAREASLGAGAVIALATAGRLREPDLDAIEAAAPRLILLAGGVDHGDRDTVEANARALAQRGLRAPVLFAGNPAATAAVCRVFEAAAIPVTCIDNVYPRIDELNIEPVKRAIQQVFSRHIVEAPGMAALRERFAGPILPTPGAVLRATERLAAAVGNVLVFDVGGATTDLHSVCDDPPARAYVRVEPEPRVKRSVEGDLGVFVSAHALLKAADARLDLAALAALPEDDPARRLAVDLTRLACRIGLERHVGRLLPAFGAVTPRLVLRGRDLSATCLVVGTGGALVRLGDGAELLAGVLAGLRPERGPLLPPPDIDIRIDRDYLMAAAGVIGEEFPGAALALMRASLGLEGDDG
jgi:hypothetical protein